MVSYKCRNPVRTSSAHVWISGVFGPAINGYHDPLAGQCGRLACFNANAWNTSVCRGEKMPGGLNKKGSKRVVSSEGSDKYNTRQTVSAASEDMFYTATIKEMINLNKI